VPDGGLRVALVLGSSTGGIGRHVLSLVRGLNADGAAVAVYCPATTEALFGFAAAGATVTALEIPASPGRRDLAVVSQLRQALRAEPVDVVHAHGLRAGLAAAWARPATTPLVVTWHNAVLGGGLRGAALRLGERLVARAADVTLAASSDLVARATELGARDVRLGEVAAPVRALTGAPGAATPEAATTIRRELDAVDRPLVLSVGRLHPQKGYHVLIEAAARWRRSQPVPVVAIVGTGPAYRELAAQILSLRAPVNLLGYRDDVPDLLAAADVAVVSSVWEARQLFAQEALRSGTPLVASRVGGLPELVGDAAVLVPAGSVDALDLAVRGLLADARLHRRYAEAGLARAATWPTEADTVAQVRAVYAELAAASRP
jgi:glycosyltransferase involved in cell wall biosynthesis